MKMRLTIPLSLLLFFAQLVAANVAIPLPNTIPRSYHNQKEVTAFSALLVPISRGGGLEKRLDCGSGFKVCPSNTPPGDGCAFADDTCCGDSGTSCPSDHNCLNDGGCCAKTEVMCNNNTECCDAGSKCCAGSGCCGPHEICCNDAAGGCCQNGYTCDSSGMCSHTTPSTGHTSGGSLGKGPLSTFSVMLAAFFSMRTVYLAL
ncbi:hypothetical protein BJ138DRAFT_1148082 [Hygrophoropsis aurantiaca]|uniref:Uncharacterized protein n=1 Tax=Hygrophoropsis aurantiaca TaxID=72124 RepID=A0ACB8AH14_9AGAM|nr:hypothetical protein BJ138DRAFT_1148082 [Hygrophoropsis aurantiaca]